MQNYLRPDLSFFEAIPVFRCSSAQKSGSCRFYNDDLCFFMQSVINCIRARALSLPKKKLEHNTNVHFLILNSDFILQTSQPPLAQLNTFSLFHSRSHFNLLPSHSNPASPLNE